MKPKIVNNLTKINLTRKSSRRIDYIVLHYYGGLSSAMNNSKYFKDTYRGASAHYFVDDLDIIRVVRDKDVAWAVGGRGRGPYKDRASNSNTLNIEIRPYKLNPSSVKSSDRDWYFHEETLDKTVSLVKYLMDLHNIPLENVIRHHDVTGKYCPRPYTGNDMNAYYGKTGNQLWLEFKQRIKATDVDLGGDDMTQEQFNAMMDEYNKEQRKLQPGEWSADARTWVEELEIFTGDQNGSFQYKKPMTREEFAVALKRYHEYK